MDYIARSPAVADNVAVFPEPVDDRIAKEVLYFKLSGGRRGAAQDHKPVQFVFVYTCTVPY